MSEEKPKSKKKTYEISPDRTHLQKLVTERIAIKAGGMTFRQVWLYRNTDFPCGMCRGTEGVFFMSLPTGIFKACKDCGLTHGIEPVDDRGNMLAILISEEQISLDDAWKLIEAHGYRPPSGLQRPRKVRTLEEE